MSRWKSLGSVPDSPEGERSLLQSRLALFGRVGTLISSGFYLIANVIVQIGARGRWSNWVEAPLNRGHIATTAVFALVWTLCGRQRRSEPELALIDALGTVGVGVGFAVMGASSHWKGDPTLPMVLAVTHTVGLRAVLIPSSAGRSAVIHALALAPTVVSAWFIQKARLGVGVAWPLYYATIYTGIWCSVAVLTSSLTSKVIYGLRLRVRESRQLGQYTLEAKLGEGGMGAVYRASHALLRRPTAIKLLHAGRGSERDLARFEREVQLTSQLTHPNTVAIYDYGRTPEGPLYYAMEYLDGIDLQDLVGQSGAQSPGRVIHVLRQIAASLGEVILCERGGVADFVKVVDFGLVKPIAADEAGVTNADAILGTPLYMAPEVVQSADHMDGRSDLYALGAVGYFLLTGHPVFESTSTVAVLADHLHTAPERPSARLGRELPADLEEVILRCLAKDPAARPANAAALDSALAACGAATSWSQAEARVWWDEYRKSTRSVVRPPGSEGVSPVTMTVEMHGRA